MIKVGILGAESKLAGEIIRLLIHHPETELSSLYAPSFTGHNVSYVHHGLIGEANLVFTDKINLDDLDVVIAVTPSELSDTILTQLREDDRQLKLIVLSRDYSEKFQYPDIETGLSEINRKALVRGAQKAVIPSPAIAPSLIALSPLAKFLLLNSEIEIKVVLPEDIAESLNESIERERLVNELKKIQTSFSGALNLRIERNEKSNRAAFTTIKMKCGLPISEIEKIYENIYDDHNFTFISKNEDNTKEAEGTQKTLIYLNKQEPEDLIITVSTDARLRGGAGDAVHVLNLFFGLHEKTGLQLKPSHY